MNKSPLYSALETLLGSMPKAALAKAASELSDRYRSAERGQGFMTSDLHRLAYLAVRMPATYAAVKRVLLECQQRIPGFSPKNMADIGAGPGTASWAAFEIFPEIETYDLYEKDAALIKVGSELMQHAPLKKALWHSIDLQLTVQIPDHDLAVLSYVVGELSETSMTHLVEQTWKSSQVIAIIEPGTPRGFERIRAVRSQLIQLGGFLVAPCPHQNTCPMANGDWCHFAERLERSSFHRDIKGVSMGYEDEKYSYVVATKQPVPLPESRVLRHPQVHSGHVDLVLCAQSGLEKKIISKKQGPLYKQARKLKWGDPFP